MPLTVTNPEQCCHNFCFNCSGFSYCPAQATVTASHFLIACSKYTVNLPKISLAEKKLCGKFVLYSHDLLDLVAMSTKALFAEIKNPNDFVPQNVPITN